MSKKRSFNRSLNNKKRIAISGITVLLGIGAILGSYFLFNRSSDSLDKGTKDEFNIDYIKYVSGIKDWIVQVGADNDYLQGVRWETYVIKGVTVDASGVSKDKEGIYNLVYKIDIKDPKEKDLEQTVTVEVVSAEKAKELARKGKDVVLAVADETNEENKEENEEENTEEDIEVDNSSKEEVASNEGNHTPPKDDTSNNSSSGSGSSHSHSWKPITNVVYHDEVGHWEEIVIKEPWAEERPIYEERRVLTCNDCGADITYLSESDIDKHISNHRANGGSGTLSAEWEKVQVGTERIDYPAVTEKKWIVDKGPWKETITTGYKCSCGATK